MDYIYDIETYPNVFLMNVLGASGVAQWSFEISDWRNDSAQFMSFMNQLAGRDDRMVGFNNLGFDYPVIHMLYRMHFASANQLYDKAMAIIRGGAFEHMVWPSDRVVEQIDLFKIHHFDNKARATSLKVLEFNMHMPNVQELPFGVGINLSRSQIETLREYCWNDIEATRQFYEETLPMIKFREELTAKYNRDFMNHNDTKIGKDYFIMKLQEASIDCYEYGPDGRKPRQTKRSEVALKDVIFPWIEFHTPELQRILAWLKEQAVTQTKGALKIESHVGGIDFVFGLGGIHGSINNEIIEPEDGETLLDLDVTSYYPSLAIAFRFYPEHLTERFCDIYGGLKEQRKHFKKGTAENAMLKLALNGVYGDSNNPYSVFYDPMFMLKTTINGQLLLCVLAEQLLSVGEGLRLIQLNTDGLTIKFPKSYRRNVEFARHIWQIRTGLELEEAEYSKMCIRDVNNYIAVYK